MGSGSFISIFTTEDTARQSRTKSKKRSMTQLSGIICLRQQTKGRRRVMKRFLKRHGGRITGTLSGFDRVLFRGTLRSIAHVNGLEVFLYSQHVLLKDFGAYTE